MIETDINFPAGLPCPLREGYDLNIVQPFVRSEMSSGRAVQRRRFSTVPTVASVTWHFNDTQAAAFEAWFRDAIHDGTDWFNCPLKTPIGDQWYVCRFTERYRGPSILGRSRWRIVASLELWERPLMPPGWGLLPDFLIESDIFDIAMNEKWPEA